MKKLIGIMTATLCLFTTILPADEAVAQETAAPIEAAAPVEATDVMADTTEKPPAQVGKASEDSTNSAKSSNIAKYALAAGAVAIGITALILVSRHHGHRHH